MGGLSDLDQILKSLDPVLSATEYVFCTIGKKGFPTDRGIIPEATFMENEGLSIVIKRSEADCCGFDYEAVFKRITLTVHSSLTAAGLTAAVSGKLARHNISANIIAAFYHDHIFVPENKAEEALRLIKELQNE